MGIRRTGPLDSFPERIIAGGIYFLSPTFETTRKNNKKQGKISSKEARKAHEKGKDKMTFRE